MIQSEASSAAHTLIRAALVSGIKHVCYLQFKNVQNYSTTSVLSE